MGFRAVTLLAAVSVIALAFPGGALLAKVTPLQVQVTSLAFNSDTCCLTYRLSAASAGRLLVDSRDGCDAPGRQWRVSVTSPGRKGAKSSVGSGSCSAWTGLATMRVRGGSPYQLTVCYDGGASATFPAAMDLRLQYSGSLAVEGPAGCESLLWGTTTTTTTTTTTLPLCTTTTTLQPCGGPLGTASISSTDGSPQTLLASAPASGTLELTITGTVCHGGSFNCQYTYDYEFWTNDPSGPSHVTNITVNGMHLVPVGSPGTPTSDHSYVVQLPVSGGDPVTASDSDTVYTDNSGALHVDMNLVCDP